MQKCDAAGLCGLKVPHLKGPGRRCEPWPHSPSTWWSGSQTRKPHAMRASKRLLLARSWACCLWPWRPPWTTGCSVATIQFEPSPWLSCKWWRWSVLLHRSRQPQWPKVTSIGAMDLITRQVRRSPKLWVSFKPNWNQLLISLSVGAWTKTENKEFDMTASCTRSSSASRNWNTMTCSPCWMLSKQHWKGISGVCNRPWSHAPKTDSRWPWWRANNHNDLCSTAHFGADLLCLGTDPVGSPSRWWSAIWAILTSDIRASKRAADSGFGWSVGMATIPMSWC